MKWLYIILGSLTLAVIGSAIYLIFLRQGKGVDLSWAEKQYAQAVEAIKNKDYQKKGTVVYRKKGDFVEEKPYMISGFVRKIEGNLYTLSKDPLDVKNTSYTKVQIDNDAQIYRISVDSDVNEIKSETVTTSEIQIGSVVRFYGIKTIGQDYYHAVFGELVVFVK